jgi:predicted dinucleotide-utilizing enzyme
MHGFLYIGQYLADAVQKHEALELAFVWNRSKDVLKGLDPNVVLDDLSQCATRCPDLIVEVSHPNVVDQVVTNVLLRNLF